MFLQSTPALPSHNLKRLKKFIIDHYQFSPSWGQVIRSTNSSRCIYRCLKITIAVLWADLTPLVMATVSVTIQRLVSWYFTSTHPDSLRQTDTASDQLQRKIDPLMSSITRIFGCQTYLPNLFRPVQSPSSNTVSNHLFHQPRPIPQRHGPARLLANFFFRHLEALSAPQWARHFLRRHFEYKSLL
jgi:hypothetical protein